MHFPRNPTNHFIGYWNSKATFTVCRVSRKMHTVPKTVPVRFLRFLGKHRRFPLCSYQAAKMAMFGRAEHVGGPAIPLFHKVVMF